MNLFDFDVHMIWFSGLNWNPNGNAVSDLKVTRVLEKSH